MVEMYRVQVSSSVKAIFPGKNLLSLKKKFNVLNLRSAVTLKRECRFQFGQCCKTIISCVPQGKHKLQLPEGCSCAILRSWLPWHPMGCNTMNTCFFERLKKKKKATFHCTSTLHYIFK